MIWLLVLPCLIIVGLIFLYLLPVPKKSIKGKHVVVIGGSSGIGKSTAILAAKLGAHVTIIARNIERLKEAEEIIKKQGVNSEQKIGYASVDVCNFKELEICLSKLETDVKPIYMFVNCAGLAICGNIEDFSLDQIKQLIDVNFLGSLFSAKAIVPYFKKRKEGIIVLTGSQVSNMGLYGYTVYSSCKFAIRGLAESLYMEMKPFNISVTLSLPPDTDTPGFESENKTKPIETKLLSETAKVVSPETVAQALMDDALSGKFFSYVGFESFVVTTLCVGMSPFRRLIDLIVEAALLGPFRLISAFYINSFADIIMKCQNDREKKEK